MTPDMDAIYRELPVEKIPWCMESPPELLVELIRNGTIRPCRAVDLGCGTGCYTIYLAQNGFEATGIDLAPTAIEIAKANATKKGVACRFITADVLGDLSEMSGAFDFAFDWELLHHIFPEERERYFSNVHDILAPGGKYLTVSFSERDPQFGGKGKKRTTPLGTVLYFSSESEMSEMLRPRFVVRDLRTIQVRGKPSPHWAVMALSERR